MSSRGSSSPGGSFSRAIGAGFKAALALGLSGALVVSGAVAASGAPVVTPTRTSKIDVSALPSGKYIVQLKEQPVATYTGTTKGYQATKPSKNKQLDSKSAPAQKYSSYLESKQRTIAASAGVKSKAILAQYTTALNGFAATLTGTQAAALTKNSAVLRVVKNEILKPTAQSSTEFLGLGSASDSDAAGLWNSSKIGGVDHAGEGIVVGDIDTGIAPENPSFAGNKLLTTPSDEPYLDGDTIVFDKADGGTFYGECETGVQFTTGNCNTKIVGARYFVDGFDADEIGSPDDAAEYLSPRDGAGHGSHTASTAAGNYGVEASIDGTVIDGTKISGVAPAAKISVYKACWSGPDPDSDEDDGCATLDLYNAINQAVEDGVDVINFSIGGGAASSTYDILDDAFLGAAAAGIFVSASAGNSGPDSVTLDHGSPWYTTVAASTIPAYYATAELGNGTTNLLGSSITVTETISNAPLVRSQDHPAAGKSSADAKLCLAGSLGNVTGNIVICERGSNARVEKSAVVKAAGGIGMILINPTANTIDPDAHSVPTIAIDSASYAALNAYAQTSNPTVTFVKDNPHGLNEDPTPQVADFSSRGPVEADGSDILKPDIAAPGVGILADGPNAEGDDPTYEFMSGTSMAAPHITGIAALYLGVSPNASVSEIKSALMTTAYNTVDADGDEFTDPFAQGAGEVDPTKMFTPGLVYDSGLSDWLAYLAGIGYDTGLARAIDPSNLNQPSIAIGSLIDHQTVTRKVRATTSGTYEPSVSGLDGVDVTISPSTLTVTAGRTYTYKVTFTYDDAPADEFVTGAIDWTTSAAGGITVHSPVAVRPVTADAPSLITGTGSTGTADVTFTPGIDGSLGLYSEGLAPIDLIEDEYSEDGHTGVGATDSDGFGTWAYPVTIPANTSLQRFDLDDLSDVSDLDLYLLNESGQAIVNYAATESGDETLDLYSPQAGNYWLVVDVYSTPSGPIDFDLWSASIPASGGVGNLTASPDSVEASAGVAADYELGWSGLAPAKTYLGLVWYGESSVHSFVSVTVMGAVVAPSISGSPVIDSTLTAAPGKWNVEDSTFAYQWLSNGSPIAGATARTYKVPLAQLGKKLSVQVTATSPAGETATATSAESAPVAKAALSVGKVTIAGTAKVDKTLTAKTTGSWPSASTTKYAYQWFASGKAIKGATKSTYTIKPTDAGKRIAVTVTVSRSGYASASATSAVTAKVAKGTLTTGKVTITGKAAYAKKVKAVKTGKWTSGISYTYQWKANGKAIKGATKSSYTIAAKYVGKKITVVVTAKKAGYATKTIKAKSKKVTWR